MSASTPAPASAPTILPDIQFRPNPNRAIYIQGKIDQQLIEKVTPQIIALQNINRDPVTVYIDSPGGIIGSAEVLLRLLQASDQDNAEPCRLITVVTSRAASAAAELLSAGDYACAFAESTLMYHGVSQPFGDPLTAEDASILRESLRMTNDRYAMTLADRSISRFLFRFVSMRREIEEYKEKLLTEGKQPLSDFRCFTDLISKKISRDANEILTQARARNKRYADLVNYVGRKARSRAFTNPTRDAEFEAAVLKRVIDFELSKNKRATWKFSRIGLAQTTDDFFLLLEYLSNYESPPFRHLCERWADSFLTDADNAELAALPNEEERAKATFDKVKQPIRPIWLFFVALCHALQEGENNFTARDAFWFGLIDEVIGASDLFPFRLMYEFAPPEDQTNATTQNPTTP